MRAAPLLPRVRVRTAPRRGLFLAALLWGASMFGCSGDEDHVREALALDLGPSGESRLAELLNCYLPEAEDPLNGPRLLVSSVDILAVRLLGAEGIGRRYEADVELSADPSRMQGVVGAPRGPVKLTFAGVVTHERKLRVMYAVPWIFSESRTTPPELLARNGFPIRIEYGGAAYGNAPVPDGPRLEQGAPVLTSLPGRMKMSDGSEIRYDDLRVAGHAGEVIAVAVTPRGTSSIGASLRPAPPLRLQTLQALIAQPKTKAVFRYDVPAEAPLLLRVWTRGDPGGETEVSLVREPRPAAR